MAKQTNEAMTDKPVKGSLKQLQRGGLETRNKGQFGELLDSIKARKVN